MYLKSFKLVNFRKFGENNNIVEFVKSKNDPQNNAISPSATLIVGKNNCGKTTVTEALSKLLGKNGKHFHSNDFNYAYLNAILEEYCKNEYKRHPKLEFELEVGVDFRSESDLVTNITPFMSIGSVESGNQDSLFKVIIKHELKEEEMFERDVRSIISTYRGKPILFRKFLELIMKSEYKSNYYSSQGDLITENKFKIRDLIDLKAISANKLINDQSLSKTFNKIISFRYKLENKNGVNSDVAKEIESINQKMTKKVSDSHTSSINTTLSKIESADHLEVNLIADLTFEKLMNNIIKYEYTEGKYHIPEGQFGLGYANLMAIIGELIDYVETYPDQEFNSKINLICIEEPEAFMHSQMQELFIEHIDEAIKYLLDDKKKLMNSQLVITTHSSHILNSKIHSTNSFNNISYMTITDNCSNVINLNDENVIRTVSTDKSKTEDKIQEESELRSNNLNFLKKHITYKVSELFFSDAIIFVEGVTEENLLPYYIDQRKELNKYYVSIFNVHGAHAMVYHDLIKLLKVPTLVITDSDIKRSEQEKYQNTQVSKLDDRTTTNQTIIKYNSGKDTFKDLKRYFKNENMHIVFQLKPIAGYFATSFEEAYVLTNYKNDLLNGVLSKIKPRIYSDIVGSVNDKNQIKQASYQIQRKLKDDKSIFANELLYQILNCKSHAYVPTLPEYIEDGLKELEKMAKKQLQGA